LEAQLAVYAQADETQAETALVSHVRHVHALENAIDGCVRAENALQSKRGLELVAYELRTAIEALQRIIGEVYSDDVLNEIFSTFCIGK